MSRTPEIKGSDMMSRRLLTVFLRIDASTRKGLAFGLFPGTTLVENPSSILSFSSAPNWRDPNRDRVSISRKLGISRHYTTLKQMLVASLPVIETSSDKGVGSLSAALPGSIGAA